MNIDLSKDCIVSFNTVNGKYCCNQQVAGMLFDVAWMSFNTVNGKYCCNQWVKLRIMFAIHCFNTVNGKYCCNYI